MARQPDKSKTDYVPPVARRYMSLQEAAAYLGFHPKALRNAVSRGDLPAYVPKGSRVLRFDVQELDHYVKSERVPAGHLDVEATSGVA